MAQLFIVVAAAAIVGLVGYDEASRYAREHGRGPFGVSTRVASLGGVIVGLLGAFVVPVLIVAGLVAYVAFREAAGYERQFREAPFGISPAVAAAVGFALGFFGAVVTSPLLWGVVCAFAALSGALFLSTCEKKTLLADKRLLVAEKNALLAEKDKARQNAAPKRTAASAAPAAPAPEPQKRWLLPLAPPAQPPRVAAPALSGSGWPGQQPRSAPGNVGDTDLLPRRR